MNQQMSIGVLFRYIDMKVEDTCLSRLDELLDDDWVDLIHESDRHGVASLLFHRFREADTYACVPDWAMQKLREIYLADSWENAERHLELTKLLKTLCSDNIPIIVILYKPVFPL